jgi:hypothetical protein
VLPPQGPGVARPLLGWLAGHPTLFFIIVFLLFFF